MSVALGVGPGAPASCAAPGGGAASAAGVTEAVGVVGAVGGVVAPSHAAAAIATRPATMGVVFAKAVAQNGHALAVAFT